MVDKSIEQTNFNRYFVAFKETLDKNDLNKFKSLNNCYDWVKWTKYASLGGQFPNDKTLGKDRSESIYFKENGNQEFLKGNKNEALELYNASLLLYPIDGGKHTFFSFILM